MASAGKTLTSVENAVSSISATSKQAKAARDYQTAVRRLDDAKKAQKGLSHAKGMKKASKAKQLRLAAKQVNDAKKAVDASRQSLNTANEAATAANKANKTKGALKSFKMSKGGPAILNLADETGEVAKLLKKCKIDKFLDLCNRISKGVSDAAQRFIKLLSKCKTLTAVASRVKAFFTFGKVTAQTASKIAPVLRFFSVAKGVVGKLLAPLAYIIEPAMMAVDGYIRSTIYEAARELDDPALIDEYEKQNAFGWSRGLSAVFTLGLSEVYTQGAKAIGQYTAANIELSKANVGMINASAKDFGMALNATKRMQDEKRKKRARDLVKLAENTDVDVSDQETHTSSWWNVGGHAGEAWANSSTRKARKGARKSENARLIGETIEIIDNNQYLLEQLKDDLIMLLQRAFFEQGAKNRHPWGWACYQAVRKLGSVRSYKDMETLYSFASDLCAGKIKPKDTSDEALQYVWGSCKNFKPEVLNYALSVEQAKNKKDTSTNIKAKPLPATKLIPKSVEKVEDRDKVIKDIFGAKSDKTKDVHGNAIEFIRKYCLERKKWPSTDTYIFGNALFVFYRNKRESFLTGCSDPSDKETLALHTDRLILMLVRNTYSKISDKLTLSDFVSAKEVVNCTDYFGQKTGEEKETQYICYCFMLSEVLGKAIKAKPKTTTKQPEPKKPAAPAIAKPKEDAKSVPKATPKPAKSKKTEITDVTTTSDLTLTKEEITNLIKRSATLEQYKTNLRIYLDEKWTYSDGSDFKNFFELTKQMYIDNQSLYKPVKGSKASVADTKLAAPKPESAKSGASLVPKPASTALKKPPVVDLTKPSTSSTQKSSDDAYVKMLLARISNLETTILQYGDNRSLLEKLVGLQADNNALVETNGKIQAEQTDVFGRKIQNLNNQQINLAQVAANVGKQDGAPRRTITPMVQLDQGV